MLNYNNLVGKLLLRVIIHQSRHSSENPRVNEKALDNCYLSAELSSESRETTPRKRKNPLKVPGADINKGQRNVRRKHLNKFEHFSSVRVNSRRSSVNLWYAFTETPFTLDYYIIMCLHPLNYAQLRTTCSTWPAHCWIRTLDPTRGLVLLSHSLCVSMLRQDVQDVLTVLTIHLRQSLP